MLDDNEKRAIWEEYVRELFRDDSRSTLDQNDSQALSGMEITRDEVLKAIYSSRDGKAVGQDVLPVDVLKLIDAENISALVRLFNVV